VALGQSSLARPGQLRQALPPTGRVVGGQRRGGRKVNSSWEKAKFERKETQQDGKTTVEYSCLHCQRRLMSDHWAECNMAQEPPAQLWRVQVPVCYIPKRDILPIHATTSILIVHIHQVHCTAPLRKRWQSRWLS